MDRLTPTCPHPYHKHQSTNTKPGRTTQRQKPVQCGVSVIRTKSVTTFPACDPPPKYTLFPSAATPSCERGFGIVVAVNVVPSYTVSGWLVSAPPLYMILLPTAAARDTGPSHDGVVWVDKTLHAVPSKRSICRGARNAGADRRRVSDSQNEASCQQQRVHTSCDPALNKQTPRIEVPTVAAAFG